MPVPANNRYLSLPSLHFCAVFTPRVHDGAAGAPSKGETTGKSRGGEEEVRREGTREGNRMEQANVAGSVSRCERQCDPKLDIPMLSTPHIARIKKNYLFNT